MSLTSASPLEVAQTASYAERSLAVLPVSARNAGLDAICAALIKSKTEILEANKRDVEKATQAAKDGKLSLSILNRLDLSRKGKWDDMLQGIRDVRDLDDPGV
jgi:glutamate-5-semialdehyde dehydrogenase